MVAESMLPDYVPGPVERFGRRYKLEYVGMTSIYVIIAFLVFAPLPWQWAIAGGVGAFFLFLGLKKKTRDHICGSLVLLAACALARPAVLSADWVIPFMLFAGCVCALEGYMEKRQEQVFLLPILFLAWGWFDASWIPGLALVAIYLTHPWVEKPGLRRRLGWLFLLSALAPLVGTYRRLGGNLGELRMAFEQTHPLSRWDLAALAAMGVPALIVLVYYWRRLPGPHRWAVPFFALLAPWDLRTMAMFAMVAAVLLTATVFRLSIDSDRLRPFFKHAEWHYFWYVTAIAVWTVAVR